MCTNHEYSYQSDNISQTFHPDLFNVRHKRWSQQSDNDGHGWYGKLVSKALPTASWPQLPVWILCVHFSCYKVHDLEEDRAIWLAHHNSMHRKETFAHCSMIQWVENTESWKLCSENIKCCEKVLLYVSDFFCLCVNLILNSFSN